MNTTYLHLLNTFGWPPGSSLFSYAASTALYLNKSSNIIKVILKLSLNYHKCCINVYKRLHILRENNFWNTDDGKCIK